MSLLSSTDRAAYHAQTGIDPLIIDRVVEGYDALIKDNQQEYRHKIATALAQQGIPSPIPESEKPTAVDFVKMMCLARIADERHWTVKRTVQWATEAAGA